MAKKNYKDMTVPELKELAEKRDVPVPSDATKAEIIAALQAADGNGNGEVAEGRDENAVNEQAAKEIEEEGADPYKDFAEPVIDGTKPVINQTTPTDVVTIIVLDGSNVPTMPEDGKDYDHLVFVQSGRSQEWLTPEAAKRKFVQDAEGQIFYNAHGVAATKEFKSVDIVALGT